jgi:hypothetical protein
MADGHLNVCKQCVKDRVEKRRIEKMKDPIWAKAEAERHRLKTSNRANMFPEKSAAHSATRLMIKKKGYHLHHWSYRPEHRKDIFELTTSDHWEIHANMKYDQERMMYRTIPDMKLLDSRDKAEAFYKKIISL